MKQDVDDVIDGNILSMIAYLEIEYHGVEKHRAVVGVFYSIKQAPLKGGDKVADIFIIIFEGIDEMPSSKSVSPYEMVGK